MTMMSETSECNCTCSGKFVINKAEKHQATRGCCLLKISITSDSKMLSSVVHKTHHPAIRNFAL